MSIEIRTQAHAPRARARALAAPLGCPSPFSHLAPVRLALLSRRRSFAGVSDIVSKCGVGFLIYNITMAKSAQQKLLA